MFARSVRVTAAAGTSPYLLQPRTCAIIGAPIAIGQPLLGVEQGPKAIRQGTTFFLLSNSLIFDLYPVVLIEHYIEKLMFDLLSLCSAGVVKKITKEGWRFIDTGDLSFPPLTSTAPRAVNGTNMKMVDEVGAANRIISDAVYEQASAGRFALTLGGDHSIGIGTVSGILRARPDVGVIWGIYLYLFLFINILFWLYLESVLCEFLFSSFGCVAELCFLFSVDAHADINTAQTSGSGNMHGMCVSFVMGHVDLKPLPQFAWLSDVKNVLRPDRIVYVGLRDLDVGEKQRLKAMGIKAYTMQHVDKYGIGKVMEMSLDHLCGKSQAPLHLSWDIDSVDPQFAPGTGTKVRGGLTDREALYICEAVAETTLLGSMDMVEVNPALAPGDSATAAMAVDLIGAAMGDTIL
jgi:arginase